MVDGHPHQVWWNADGETIVESYTITDMAHGTPLGIADNDERYGAEGAFLIEAGISSSYHIANFFGLTERIHQPKRSRGGRRQAQAAKPCATFRAAAQHPTCHSAVADSRISRLPSRARRRGVRAIDVSAVITRALTAAGLMK